MCEIGGNPARADHSRAQSVLIRGEIATSEQISAVKLFYEGRKLRGNSSLRHYGPGSSLNILLGYFPVFTKTLTGTTLSLNVTKSTKISQIRSKMMRKYGIPCDAHICAGKELNEAKSLSECNIYEAANLHLVLKGPKVTF